MKFIESYSKSWIPKSNQYYFGVTLYCLDENLNQVCENHCNVGEIVTIDKDNIVEVALELSEIIFYLDKKMSNIQNTVNRSKGVQIMLGEINSYEPFNDTQLEKASELLKSFNVDLQNQSKLLNTFILRPRVYDGDVIDVPRIMSEIGKSIKRDLFDVLESIKTEESYNPNEKVCDLIDVIQTHHKLKKETVETLLPCRIGEMEKLGIKT